MPERYDIKGSCMVITKKFIVDNKTLKGAWTKPQIEVLGIKWPPTAGWMNRVIGTEISNENAAVFMSRITVKTLRKNRRSHGVSKR